MFIHHFEDEKWHEMIAVPSKNCHGLSQGTCHYLLDHAGQLIHRPADTDQ